MINLSKDKILAIIFSILTAVFIFFNPLTYGTGDINRINMLFNGINSIFKALGINFIIKREKMLDTIIVIEYMILGISLAQMTKVLFGRVLKNISKPLLIGLLSAVFISYYGYINKWMISGISSVITMFIGLISGLGLYIFIDFIKLIFLSKRLNTKTKYKRGR